MKQSTSHKNVSAIEKQVWEALQEVADPEIPPLSVVDLGIISKVEIKENGGVCITLTPTFSGCPAIHIMRKNIEDNIRKHLPSMEVDVQIDFGTQWTSNKITDKGRQILADFKLAPPGKYEGELDVSSVSHAKCPHCGSENTSMNSPFGPTLCRSIHYCFDCLQSFQQFKPV